MDSQQWNESEQQRLDELRSREETGTLSAPERTELDHLLTVVDGLEWQQLRPTLEQMEREHAAAAAAIERLERTRGDLSEVIARQRQLIIRAQGHLRELLTEHRTLLADYRRLNIEVPTP